MIRRLFEVDTYLPLESATLFWSDTIISQKLTGTAPAEGNEQEESCELDTLAISERKQASRTCAAVSKYTEGA
jgi:hypothetical protein